MVLTSSPFVCVSLGLPVCEVMTLMLDFRQTPPTLVSLDKKTPPEIKGTLGQFLTFTLGVIYNQDFGFHLLFILSLYLQQKTQCTVCQ